MIRVLNYLEKYSIIIALFNMIASVYVIEAIIKILGV